MTDAELFQKLRPIVELVTGLPSGSVIMADQNASAPLGEYATIRPRQSIAQRGQANIYTSDVAGDLVQTDVRAQIVASCTVNFYRGNAVASAEKLKQCNKRPDVSILLFKAGLGWGGTDAANNLTALQAANWEPRAQITIRLMYETSDVSTINNILSVGIIVENEKGNILHGFMETYWGGTYPFGDVRATFA